MKLMAYTDEECTESHPVDHLFIDGYSFGDRLLEGVMFKLSVVVEGELTAQCQDKYSKGIDWNYWEKVCVEHALEDDCFSTTIEGVDDNGYIEQ